MFKMSDDTTIKSIMNKADAEHNIICERCNEPRAYNIKGVIHQPCAQCQLKEKKAHEQDQVKRTQYLDELDHKFKNTMFEKYKVKNDKQKKMFELVTDYTFNYENGKWLVLFGSQGTGKTMIKNCVLKELGARGYSFINTTAPEMYNEWRDCNSNDYENSLKKKVEKYTSADILCIDETGRNKDSQGWTDFLFNITNTIYNNNKTLIIISNFPPKRTDGKSIDDIFDSDRLNEMCSKGGWVSFYWDSFRKK